MDPSDLDDTQMFDPGGTVSVIVRDGISQREAISWGGMISRLQTPRSGWLVPWGD